MSSLLYGVTICRASFRNDVSYCNYSLETSAKRFSVRTVGRLTRFGGLAFPVCQNCFTHFCTTDFAIAGH